MSASYEMNYDISSFFAGIGTVGIILSLAISVLVLIAYWKIYQKAGRPGWAAIIPFYNIYVLFDLLYGNGWKMFFLLIPFFNIYVSIKAWFDLAHAYKQSTGFGVGLWLLSPIFLCILGFGSAEYDGRHPVK